MRSRPQRRPCGVSTQSTTIRSPAASAWRRERSIGSRIASIPGPHCLEKLQRSSTLSRRRTRALLIAALCASAGPPTAPRQRGLAMPGQEHPPSFRASIWVETSSWRDDASAAADPSSWLFLRFVIRCTLLQFLDSRFQLRAFNRSLPALQYVGDLLCLGRRDLTTSHRLNDPLLDCPNLR